MKATITYIQLKSPLKVFHFTRLVAKIITQLKNSPYQGFASRGFWTKYYTITLWKNENDMKTFATSGAHLEAMKNSKAIAKEIRTITFDTEEFPSWKTARKILIDAKQIRY